MCDAQKLFDVEFSLIKTGLQIIENYLSQDSETIFAVITTPNQNINKNNIELYKLDIDLSIQTTLITSNVFHYFDLSDKKNLIGLWRDFKYYNHEINRLSNELYSKRGKQLKRELKSYIKNASHETSRINKTFNTYMNELTWKQSKKITC